tara:strand:+ start:15149 stop:15499 length:351 start_codon:yes stop_codon:yes gene_type:complete
VTIAGTASATTVDRVNVTIAAIVPGATGPGNMTVGRAAELEAHASTSRIATYLVAAAAASIRRLTRRLEIEAEVVTVTGSGMTATGEGVHVVGHAVGVVIGVVESWTNPKLQPMYY